MMSDRGSPDSLGRSPVATVRRDDCDETLRTRNTFETVEPAIREADPRARDEVPDGRRRQNLSSSGGCRDASGDVDRDAGDVVADDLDVVGAIAAMAPDIPTQRVARNCSSLATPL